MTLGAVAPLYTGLRVDGRRVVVDPNPALSRWLRGEFWAEYEADVELATVPEEILCLPFLWTVAPIVWASGLRFQAPRLDERQPASLAAVRGALRRGYRSLPWSGEIQAGAVRRVEHRTGATGEGAQRTSRPDLDAAALFSGGADSTWTAVRHSDERLLLVVVHGADLPLSDEPGRRALLEQATAFGERRGHRVSGVRSNFREFVDRRAAERLSAELVPWYPRVQHGMALTALAAPLLFHHRLDRIYIAATHKQSPAAAWGSSHAIDDNVVLGPARVVHDGSDLSRTEKIERLLSDAASPVFLRVCYVEAGAGARNCGECEKCVRTITTILAVGADPRRHGFPEYGPHTLRKTQRAVERRAFKLLGPRVHHWQAVGDVVRRRGVEGLSVDEADYLRWVADWDSGAYARRHGSRPARIRRRLGRLALAARFSSGARPPARPGQ